MFKTLNVSACDEALRHTLQIVSALHGIIHYLISFSKLGNRQDSLKWGRGHDAAGSLLAADWGGAESIGTELQELQQQVDHLSDPSNLESVGRLLQLRRQVLLLQFDTAVRIFVREAFLSSGDVTSCQSVNDNMANALPPMIGCIQTDVFSLTLPVPQPLENQGCQLKRFHGYLQLCLSSLSSRSRLQANAAILGVSLLMEDVLNGGREAEPVRLHATVSNKVIPIKINSSNLQDPIRVQSVLKGFLLLTKQLEVFKERWALRRLGADVFSTPALDEIFYPSMRALAKQMDKEHHYEVLISGTQSLLPPPGASEVDVKAWQLHLLMESTECDMIRAVQRKMSRELTLVLSEKTQQDNRLPTELWKRSQMKYSLSREKPQMVETFIQQLMQGVSRDHLQQCLTHLCSTVMERERQCFLLYSQFYEQILQQHTQLLYQREQIESFQTKLLLSSINPQVADLCRGMMLEVSALWAQVAHLEEEKINLEEQLGLTFKERYHPLVRHLFSTCIQLKVKEQGPLLKGYKLSGEEAWIYSLNVCWFSLTEELQVFRHRSAREARSRQELDAHLVQTLEQMRADMEDRDRQLRALGEQLDRGSRINRLQRERSAKEIRQVCTLINVLCTTDCRLSSVQTLKKIHFS
uniref:Uncharacterized protein n=1 Tax=Maylandia zebra TaxID=106582 RepID=A0A3P9C5L8_9CICH